MADSVCDSNHGSIHSPLDVFQRLKTPQNTEWTEFVSKFNNNRGIKFRFHSVGLRRRLYPDDYRPIHYAEDRGMANEGVSLYTLVEKILAIALCAQRVGPLLHQCV